ncbi:VPLPA-CTERM sorting domain-containing protein [Mangrovicoccus ximenensis]|uniref:VPLPA-CTERM sorting domain-containing protein n=1 Tax=Mangrovicoccus ximenensis TaxID=1911570 RepID=UPI000D3B51A2|nr:VPLPA-CTERM sorting domain-containing protein [Mangrovicoccus ximenensis]
MKSFSTLAFAVLSLSPLTVNAATVHSQPSPATPSGIVSFVDCNPVSASLGQTPQASGTQTKSCSDNGVTGRSSTSFDTVKTFVEVSGTSPSTESFSGYRQSGHITDSILITPSDPSKVGSSGQVAITMHYDGTMAGDVGFEIGSSYYINNFNGTVTRNYVPELFSNIDIFDAGGNLDSSFGLGAPSTTGRFGYGTTTTEEFYIVGYSTAVFDVTIGDYLTYEWVFSVLGFNLFGTGGIADFENTALLNSFSLFDDSGNEIAATFTSSSGEVVALQTTSPSAIPLPAGLPLLLGGLAAFGLIRKSRAAT